MVGCIPEQTASERRRGWAHLAITSGVMGMAYYGQSCQHNRSLPEPRREGSRRSHLFGWTGTDTFNNKKVCGECHRKSIVVFEISISIQSQILTQ